MHHLIACIFCGSVDPNADSLLLQAAIAGAVTTPWVLRARLTALFARLRGTRRRDEAQSAACELPEADDGDLPTSLR